MDIDLETEKDDPFYEKAIQYWSTIPPTLDGMLGGFGFLTDKDIQGSRKFLTKLFQMNKPPGKTKALDCGAGIGRITKNLLIHFFDKVDLIEQCPKFLEEAKKTLENSHKVGDFFCLGLQNFTATPNTYDIIWCQWVLGHLTDEDLVKFLKNCVSSLLPNGIIVIKENLSSNDIERDETDSSVTRPINHLKQLFTESGLRCIHEQKQRKFPKSLFDVFMFALKPYPSNTIEDDTNLQNIDINNLTN